LWKRKTLGYRKKMIKLIEVCEQLKASNSHQRKYTLREIFINPKHVVALREESSYTQKLEEGLLPEELDSRQQFTRLTLDRGQSGLDVIVIGAPHLVESKLRKPGGAKNVLKG